MVPILLCSIVAAAISVERLWTLQRSRITPKNLLAQVWGAIKNDEVAENAGATYVTELGVPDCNANLVPDGTRVS